MAETSSLEVAQSLIIPSISAQTHLASPEVNNSSIDKTTDEISSDYVLPTEEKSCSLRDLLVVTHSHIPVLPPKSKLIFVPLITLHFEEQH